MNNLKVSDIIDSNFAVATEDGQKIYDHLNQLLSQKLEVLLDFSDIQILTTAFLNAAIGQLYSKFNTQQIQPFLKLINVMEEDRILFKKVIERAKEYFAEKEKSELNSDQAIYGTD